MSNNGPAPAPGQVWMPRNPVGSFDPSGVVLMHIHRLAELTTSIGTPWQSWSLSMGRVAGWMVPVETAGDGIWMFARWATPAECRAAGLDPAVVLPRDGGQGEQNQHAAAERVKALDDDALKRIDRAAVYAEMRWPGLPEADVLDYRELTEGMADFAAAEVAALKARADKAEWERDEARRDSTANANAWRAARDEVLAMEARAENAEKQRDAYLSSREMHRERAEKAERERDEAWRSTGYIEVQKARRKRDEARAEVAKLQEQVRIADRAYCDLLKRPTPHALSPEDRAFLDARMGRAERIEAVDNRLDMAFKTLEKVCEAVEVDRIGDTPAPPWFAGLCMALGLIEQARTALAAPAERQEPVAWGLKWPERDGLIAGLVFTNIEEAESKRIAWFDGAVVVQLYTHPPAERQGGVDAGLWRIPSRTPRWPRWSHGYEFSLTVDQLDDVREGRARTPGPDEAFGAGVSEPVSWPDVGHYRLLATIEVLLEELSARQHPPAAGKEAL